MHVNQKDAPSHVDDQLIFPTDPQLKMKYYRRSPFFLIRLFVLFLQYRISAVGWPISSYKSVGIFQHLDQSCWVFFYYPKVVQGFQYYLCWQERDNCEGEAWGFQNEEYQRRICIHWSFLKDIFMACNRSLDLGRLGYHRSVSVEQYLWIFRSDLLAKNFS